MSGTDSVQVDATVPELPSLITLSMEQKIDKLLEFNVHIAKAVKNVDNALQDVQTSLSTKIEAVEAEVTTVKQTAEDNKTEVAAMRTEIDDLKTYVKNAKIREINQAVHGRRYDIIISRLPDANTWEPAGKSIEIVRKFLRDINIADPDDPNNNDDWDPDSVVIKEAHRLPQNPIQTFISGNRENTRRTWPRPMIVRLDSMLDKRIIKKKCKNLKILNQGKDKNNRIYVDDHWPSDVAKQRKDLRADFNRLKAEGKKPRFRYNIETATTTIEIKES